jgi:3-deoxy-manno-octulosonate cytidylyltransferase (CMP-KDO synthetase)
MTVVVGLVPARYPSTRFPGKPLALLHGKPMIQWTYEACERASSLTHVAVCTDDPRIRDACVAFGARVVMTSPDHECGTDRCAEAARTLAAEIGEIDYVVNIQGDEPLVEPAHIDACVAVLMEDESAVVG